MIIKSSSIKVNYLLNLTRLILNILVLAVSMPYVTRVLGSAGIGRVEYAYAIIEYFFLFSALGIPMYGIRQIARCRDNVAERSKVVVELLIILFVTTLLAYLGLYILLSTVNYTADFKSILAFLSIGILLSNFGVEWFYMGIENQRFITIRHVVIKSVALILLYMLVNSPADTYYYGLFLIISTFGGSIFNIIYLRKFIRFDRATFSDLNIKRHIKPSLTILLASISTSIYMQLDKIMLGSMVSEVAVGYYSVAIKLPRQALIIVTTMGAVMLPRLSHLLHSSNKEEYIKYMQKSLKYILLVAVPATIGFFMLAREIILVMAGEKFIPAIATLRISSFLIFIVALAYYIGFQLLYPAGKERVYTISVTIAAAVNFIFNLFAIKHLQQDGAALGTLIAEVTGLAIMMVVSRRSLVETGFFKPGNVIYLIAGFVMAGIIYLFSFTGLTPFIHIIVASATGMFAYIAILYLLGETTVKEVLVLVANYRLKGSG
jgi:O-antigen/teichoic acid export membrane protein